MCTESWVQFPEANKPGVVADICSACAQEVKTQGSGIEEYPWIHIQFKASLGYLRLSPQGNKTHKILWVNWLPGEGKSQWWFLEDH